MSHEIGNKIWIGDKEWEVTYEEDGFLELNAVEVEDEDEKEDTNLDDLFDVLPENLLDYFFDHGKEIDLGDLDAGWVGFVIERGDDSFIMVDSVTGDSLYKSKDKEAW